MPRAAAFDDSKDSRESILRAALKSFAEKGYDGSSTREIATQAGVNQGLIPYYFGGKLKLWQAAVDLAFGELAAGLEVALADSDTTSERDRTALLLRNYVRFVARNPEFVRLMHEEGKRKGPRMRWLVDRHVKPMYDAVKALMARTQSRGALPPDIDPIHFHYLLAGAVGLIFHQAEECKRLSGIDPFDDAVVEEHARVVEYLFLGPPIEEFPV
jgi:TetR/AcrR family transcriptional regulator